MKTLIFIDDELENIEKLFSSLCQVTDFELSVNEMTAIPENIDDLVKVEKLNLGSEVLTHIPDSIGSLANLTDLSISSNMTYNFPETLSNLKKLEKLTIYSPIDKADLPIWLHELPNLTLVKFNDDFILGTEQNYFTPVK